MLNINNVIVLEATLEYDGVLMRYQSSGDYTHKVSIEYRDVEVSATGPTLEEALAVISKVLRALKEN